MNHYVLKVAWAIDRPFLNTLIEILIIMNIDLLNVLSPCQLLLNTFYSTTMNY